ncbi:MAG: hypothetical protein RR891_00345 [Clostridium sp.]|uniref:hypothetical protein n=1 Tax=Clostridium sp. TaxID=1506 RepID=UPI00302197E2
MGKKATMISIRDGIYGSIGFVICLLSAFEVFGANDLIYSVSVFIGILLVQPTIKTNRKIALRYREIVSILGDKFELYFTCKGKK